MYPDSIVEMVCANKSQGIPLVAKVRGPSAALELGRHYKTGVGSGAWGGEGETKDTLPHATGHRRVINNSLGLKHTRHTAFVSSDGWSMRDAVSAIEV